MSEGLRWLQCPVCKETIYWEVPTEALKTVKRFPAAVVVRHKDHCIIIYVDSHYQLADAEVAAACLDSVAGGP